MLSDHSSLDAAVPDTSQTCCICFREIGDRLDIQKILISSFFVVCTCTCAVLQCYSVPYYRGICGGICIYMNVYTLIGICVMCQ